MCFIMFVELRWCSSQLLQDAHAYHPNSRGLDVQLVLSLDLTQLAQLRVLATVPAPAESYLFYLCTCVPHEPKS